MDPTPLIQTGALASAAGVMLALVRIAVRAERGRADDWRGAARARAEESAIMAGHVQMLVGSVDKLSTSVERLAAAHAAGQVELAAQQVEVLTLLRGLARDRGAP